MSGNGTQDRIPVPPGVRRRTPRESLAGFRIKWKTLLIATALLGSVAGSAIFIWKASTAFGGKADVVRVQAVEKQVDSLVTDVEVIKNDVKWIRESQHTIIKALEK